MAVPSPGNAVLQCVHQIPGGMFPGKVIKVRGSTPLGARKFDINLQCGPNINLHDDIALHLSVRFFEGCVIRNHLSSKSWGSEERGGGLPINRGELFEASILCGPNSFQVALNGVKFYEFTHRLPFQRITHITVDGDVMLISVDFESARCTSPLQKNMLRIGEEYVYSVVQFLELPYAGIDDYVCVPYSWIRVRRTTDHKVMVAYPVESPLITKRRIERTERASEKWSSYIAIVKYETNSYDDAYVFILTTNLTAYNTSTENRCSNVKNRDDEQQLPVRIIQINNSSLKRTKISERKPENQQKKMRVTEKAEFESLEASKCSNIESGTGMLFTPSSHVSAEKMTVQMTNENSSSSQGVSLETDTMSSVCLNSCSGNRALLSQAHSEYTQQDPRRQGFLDGDSTSYRIGVITKSALLKGSTANTVFTVQDPSNPSYQPFQLSKHQNHPSVHRGPSMPHLRLQETSERTNDTQFTNPGILSQNFSDNPPLVQFSPIIIANQNFQTYQQPQANQFLSVYKDYLQNIPLNKDIHKRTSSNSNTFPSYISTNQNCVRGDGSMLTVQNPSSVAIRSSQMPMSSLCPNHLPVPLRQEKLVGQTSGYPEFLPVTENRSHQNTLVSGVYVDEPLETNCIKQSIYYQRGIENEPFATSNSPNKANQSCQSVQRVLEGGLSTVDKDTTGDMLSTQYFEGNEQSDPIERNPEGASTASQKSSNPEKQSLDSHLAVQQSWFDEMADIFDQISSDFFQTCKAADDLRDSLIHSAKTFQRIANLTANLRKVKRSEAHATAPKNVTMAVREVTEKGQSPRENQEGSGSKNKGDADSSEESGNDDTDRDEDYRNSDEDDEDDSEHDVKGKEAMKKIRGHIRSFVLPPEYDPDDTKWTLQHRNPDPKRGIIELVPQSGVYVDAIKLSNCKRISKDCKTLARMLLVEIFSRSALSVCSLTGARANPFDTEGAHVRPGLDQHARMVLMTYVEDHSQEKNWPPFSTQSVTNSIRSKIQEIRARYGKTK